MDCSEQDYVQRLIGQPWQRTGLHCWALVIQTQRDLYRRELPLMRESVPGRTERRELLSRQAERYGWREVAAPVHGCVVRMYHTGGNPADLEHVGVFFDWDGGVVMHTDNPHGVVLDTLHELRLRGWEPRYFVPKDDPA